MFNRPDYFINRELSWLEFNERVLEEAQDKTNPSLERFKFLAITASNLDEFFMVRVSGLMEQEEAEFMGKDPSGLNPKEQLTQIALRVHSLVSKQYNCLNRSLLPAMEKEDISFLSWSDLSKKQKEFVRKYFESTVFPILTPMAIDQSRRFPLLTNKSLNLIVEVTGDEEEVLFAVVQVPSVISRILELPCDSGKRQFILLEEIMKTFVAQLFSGRKVEHCGTFRITRNSDLLIDEEEADDLLYEIERSIKRRKWGEPVRLEIEKSLAKKSLKYLEKILELDSEDIYEINGPIDLTIFFSFYNLLALPQLKDEQLKPQPLIEFADRDIFELIREKDLLVHHPYDSFDCVLDYVRAAAKDPNVLAIKQTLYRVSGNSPIVSALIQAAENGKQVTVIVELKARFDEENNILWAKKLEKAGCHVVYGLVGLKTHCKICLVVRNEEEGIRRYVHLGTGNYNDSTAKIYTDLGYFTSKESFGRDVTSLFNLLTGYSISKDFQKLAVAPLTLRETFLRHIKKETAFAKDGKPACIIAKMNSLVDVPIIEALYEASCAGVKIKLIVRGVCCLKSGVENLSKNITVVSIVDRFLEHSRIYYFENGGNPSIYLSSADWMPRNLDRRVETAFPIEDADLKEKIIEILDITLSDTLKLRVQQPDGSYEKVDRRGKENLRSQLVFYQLSVERNRRDAVPEEEMFKPIFKKDTGDVE